MRYAVAGLDIFAAYVCLFAYHDVEDHTVGYLHAV